MLFNKLILGVQDENNGRRLIGDLNLLKTVHCLLHTLHSYAHVIFKNSFSQ